MSEELTETTPPVSTPAPLKEVARQIAKTLNESNIPLIYRTLTVLGLERTQAFLGETLALEAQAGLLTSKGTRRRTPGGVFFYLIRQAVTRAEYKQLWPPVRKKPVANGEGAPQPAPKPVVSITWDQVKDLVQQAKAQPGEAKTVKITLVGRPLKVIKQGECVIVSLKGKEPGAFPKGLPAPPANSAITWAVFIAAKQWEKVAASITNQPEDRLVVEGYPLLKDGVAVVLAQSCKSVMTEQATKAQKAGQ